MKVGFIGVGNIGRPMAGQIAAAGFELVVHDVRKDAAAPLVEGGATWADTPKAVAEQVDVVCTCLPGPPEMEEVTLGPRGIAEGIRAGSTYIDHTTNSPNLVRRVHAALSERQADMLDAPVSGGMEGARTRDLTILVGGDAVTFERIRPVLDAMGKNVMHVGEIGSGCVCKIAHNCASFVRQQALVECLTLGVKAGVEPTVLLEVFQKAALGRNFDLHVRLPATLFRGDFEPRFAMKVARKDMALAMELAESNGVPMGAARATEREMEEAMSRGWGDRDSSIFLSLQEEKAGVELRVGE